MFSWWLIAILGILIVAAAIIVAIARARRRSKLDAKDEASGSQFVLMAFIVSSGFAGIMTLLTIPQVIGIATATSLVPIRTSPFWPELPIPQADIGGLAFVENGGLTAGEVHIPDLSLAARLWDIAAVVIGNGAAVFAAVLVGQLCQRLRWGRGLTGTGRAFGTLALVALLAGYAWQIAAGIGGYLAIEQVSPGTAGRAGDLFADWPAVPDVVTSVDGWPLFAFLALSALAVAFRYAERLQQDTEGLV